MCVQTEPKPIVKGSQVKHIKSNGRNQWYRKLINGVVELISKSGKSAEVRWIDKDGK